MLMSDAQARLERLAKQKKRPYCDICKKPIFEECEYVITRRRSMLLYHTACIKKGEESGKQGD